MSNRKISNRYDFSIISGWIEQGYKVLDLGCGDGGLLNFLKKEKNITGYGIEKDDENWLKSLESGINVIQMDLEAGLSGFENNSFDIVILSKTIQSMHNIEIILDEMLRVGKQIIVTFPNFGYWRNRFQMISGSMPISKELPYAWFNTPNIHLCTIDDFDQFCQKKRFQILEKLILTNNESIRFMPNLFGALVLYKLVSK
jgi:methionine biosynthesis protein MetW